MNKTSPVFGLLLYPIIGNVRSQNVFTYSTLSRIVRGNLSTNFTMSDIIAISVGIQIKRARKNGGDPTGLKIFNQFFKRNIPQKCRFL